MGYNESLFDYFVSTLLQKTKEFYICGKYEIVNHTNYGVKINIFIDIPGVNDKKDRVYKLKTCYMVFSNGKIKMNNQ